MDTTPAGTPSSSSAPPPPSGVSVPELRTLHEARDAMRAFVAERGWMQFHTPRNLLLALVGEVGELAEVFRWEGECDLAKIQGWEEKKR